MRGKRILIAGALLLIPFIAVNCAPGVSQEEYDKVKTDIAVAQSEIQAMQGDYEKAESDLAVAQAQVESLQGEVEALKEKVARAREQVEMINAVLVPALTGEIDTTTDAEAISLILGWAGKIEASADPVLQERFQAMVDSGFADTEVIGFFLYLIESTPKILE